MKILIVDDYELLRKTLKSMLTQEKFEVVEAATGKEALDVLKKTTVDLIILDQEMPEMNGFEAFQEIQKKEPDIPVIFLTGYGQIELAVQAIKLGASDYLTKPPDRDLMLASVRRALKLRSLEDENAMLREALSLNAAGVEFLGSSPAVRDVFTQIKLVAKTDYSVLVQGESGTGKELVAQLVHANSPRSTKPFVAIDTGAIPRELIESEFFGHEKGAFTGADQEKIGLFESAQGGTLFLDEISNFPMDAQYKILRAIQEKMIRRVGGNTKIPMDVRFVFATNLDLQDQVKKEKFREDLYYRISEFVIKLPPLRDRGPDALQLAGSFLAEAAKYLEKKLNFSEAAKKAILDYAWPGNVRELKNRVKRAALVADRVVESKHLFESAVPGKPEIQNLNASSFNDAIRDFEKNLLADALKKYDGNKAKAAQSLNMYYASFCRKLKQHQISDSFNASAT